MLVDGIGAVGAICSGLRMKRSAGGGAEAIGLAPGMAPAVGFAITGDPDSTGAALTARGGTGTRLLCTSRRPVKTAPRAAVTPPGAFQLA